MDTDDKNNNEKEQTKKLISHSGDQQRKVVPSSIDIQELIEDQDKKADDQHNEYQRDLGLVLPRVQTHPENPLETERPPKARNNNLGLINAVSIEV